jgi:hypothetical protein
LAASAPASAALVWVTEPLSPGLPMRTETLLLEGLTCTASASASADCSLWADCPTTCVPPPSLQQCDPPPWSCSADWVVVFPFSATASAPAALVCLTGPSLPGLSIRTLTLSFDGLTWTALAVAPASCSLPAFWLVACEPDPDWSWLTV